MTNCTIKDTNTSSQQQNAQISILSEKVDILTQEKISLMNKLKKNQEEKDIIKKNSVEVLNILREQFGNGNDSFTSAAIGLMSK
jgi:hypothetical protein